jgi:signal transduction histidine kinase
MHYYTKNTVLVIFPRGDQAYLCQPFDRGSDVETFSGTGLRLSIVKQAVDLCVGEITVESCLGQGKKFGVIMPQKLR